LRNIREGFDRARSCGPGHFFSTSPSPSSPQTRNFKVLLFGQGSCGTKVAMEQELGDDQAFEACTIGLWKSPATLCAHRNPIAGPRADRRCIEGLLRRYAIVDPVVGCRAEVGWIVAAARAGCGERHRTAIEGVSRATHRQSLCAVSNSLRSPAAGSTSFLGLLSIFSPPQILDSPTVVVS
jgi:hypothetical protein